MRNILVSTNQSNIAQLGHPILKTDAKPVTDIFSPTTQAIITDLLTTVDLAGGVGIAAPQLFYDARIFIICSKPNERYPDAPLMPPTVMINPEIVQHDDIMEKGWEGCLSVPSIRGLVPRYKNITVSYFDQQAQPQTKELTDFVARIFQHELDHLNGKTFIDQVSSNQDLISEAEWYRQYS